MDGKAIQAGEHVAAVMVDGGVGHLVTPPSRQNRETWGKKIDFLLSVIGFCVDLGNVWRFPHICFKNGGGAFLIPYLIMLIFCGIPMFYLELSLGQYNETGAITTWDKICPLFKGIGWAVVLIAFFVDFYYNVIIGYAFYYFFASFNLNGVPWSSCDNAWNTDLCYEAGQGFNQTNPITVGNVTMNVTYQSAATQYYQRRVLEMHESDGLNDIGRVVWAPALCLLMVYIICYFSLWKGIKGSGKVVWFTATFPYVVLFILLIRGVTLEGAWKGISFYIIPKFDRLANPTVWLEAATQIFFSLGPGFGVLLTFASYNKFHENIYRDAILTSSINCMTSFISGLVVFATLGHMALRQDMEVDELEGLDGPGLVFITYPEALAMMPGSSFWSLMFFLMLITIGLDSSFGGSEAIITGISDQFPNTVKKHREIFIACLFTVYFLVGLAFMSQGGTYLFNLFDVFTAQYSIVFVVFCEAIAVSWFYGVDRVCGDIKEMLGFQPGIFWRTCWTVVSPAILLAIVIGGFVTYTPLVLYDYIYDDWVMAIGWCLACSSMACIPAVAVYKLLTTEGSIRERFLKNITTPKQYPEMPERDNDSSWYSPTVQNGTRL